MIEVKTTKSVKLVESTKSIESVIPKELPKLIMVKNISNKLIWMSCGKLEPGNSGKVTQQEFQNHSQYFELGV